MLWHLGYVEEASTAAFTQPYQAFQRAAVDQEPTYRVRGMLTDGFDSTTKSMRTLFPGARLGYCLRHALNKLQRKGFRVFALGQRLRHFVDHVTTMVGTANRQRVRH